MCAAPAEETAGFERRNWFSVDPAELPPGELVIGLNPPFGHNNTEAIKFVTHALHCRPRLLVLIMPTTNWQPPGYELIHHDDQLCRGSVFYTPGESLPPHPKPHPTQSLTLPSPRPRPRPRPPLHAPGSKTSNWINARNVSPDFFLYRRRDDTPGPSQRFNCCPCFRGHRDKVDKYRTMMNQRQLKACGGQRHHRPPPAAS